MTEQPPLPGIEAAQAEIEQLASKVGFVRKHLPQINDAKQPPDGAAYWSSEYARVLLWPLASSEASTLENGMLEAEGWLDAALHSEERCAAGRALDGYLVLAMPTAPSKDADDEVRRIELSSRICRKHLIWPGSADKEGAQRWTRIADVTVLGLPEASVGVPTGELQWPELDPAAQEVWQLVSVEGGKEAARVEADKLGLDGDQL